MQHNKPTLLIVEDDTEVREVIIESLCSLDVHIVEKENGKLGLQTALFLRPEAILTDINMPQMNGLQMIKELRKSNFSLPIVVLSAFGDRVNTVEALRLGAYEFLGKPFKFDHLLEVVSSAVDLGIKLKQFDIVWDEFLDKNPELKQMNQIFLTAQKEILKMKYFNQKKVG